MCATYILGCKLPDTWGGAFSDDLLAATVAKFAGAGDDANQPASVRFLRSVARLIKNSAREASPDTVTTTPAVFLLRPNLPASIERADAEFHPMLDTALAPLEGRVWLVSQMASSGYCVRHQSESDAEMFDLINRKFDLGGVTAVVYDPRATPTQIRYYPSGLEEPDVCEVTELSAGIIELGAVLAVVDRLYESKLVTPNAQSQAGKLWARASKHYPREQAELTIEMYLETALLAAFPTCTVRTEQSQVTGRLDVELEERDPQHEGQFVRHALLELKVLRTFRSSGAPVPRADAEKRIDEGVDQAFSYREERGVAASALCCFDMRARHTGMECFRRVAKKAAELRVTLKVWYLFGSAREYRAFRATASAGGGAGSA
jgi:hypothetical protein